MKWVDLIVVALILSGLCAKTELAAQSIIDGPVNNPANSHNYFLLSHASSTNSEAFAVSIGGHLVTINDADENDWVLSQFGFFDGISRRLWIGLTDEVLEGNFVWVSGAPVAYTNWLGGEPNGGTAENWTHMYGLDDPFGHAAGAWNDVKADDSQGSLGPFAVVEVANGGVEVSIAGNPNPATIGDPFILSLTLSNPGEAFEATISLFAFVDGNMIRLLNRSGVFLESGYFIEDFPIFSTLSLPDLPPAIAFIIGVFDNATSELIALDTEIVGVGTAVDVGTATSLRQTAEQQLRNAPHLEAAPPGDYTALNGEISLPWTQRVTPNRKLTTTWGRIKLRDCLLGFEMFSVECEGLKEK